jgi:integrase
MKLAVDTQSAVKVFFPDAAKLRRLGFGPVAEVPVLFGRDNKLCRIESRYLRDRARGLWSRACTADHIARVNAPAPKSVRHFAHALSVFLTWCDARGKHWLGINYDDVLLFQREMIFGIWSPSQKRLSPKTANFRADEATSFLLWAAAHRLREPFDVYYVTARRPLHTGRSSVVQTIRSVTRGGRAKTSRSAPVGTVSLLPSPEVIIDWLSAVREQRGEGKYFAAKFILETGTRLFETVAITNEQIPSAEKIAELRREGANTGAVEIYVTKGGRPRTILVPLAFLEELRRWIDGRRLRLLFRWSKRTRGRSPEQLFVSDAPGHEGTPISASTLYLVFKKVRPRPAKWHPHFARHVYACLWTLRALTADASADGRTLRSLGVDWIYARGTMHLRLLRDQLGHLDERTTEMYLRWIATAAGLQQISESWHEMLSGEEDEE